MSEKKKKKHLPEVYLGMYRPRPFIRIAQISGFVVMILVLLILGFFSEDWFAVITESRYLLLWAALLVVMLWTLFITWRDRLIITENGLLWWKYGIAHEVTWDALCNFRRYSRGRSKAWGIQTNVSNLLPFGDFVDVPTVNQGLFKSDVDEAALLLTKAGAYLYQYAPHLFEEFRSKKHDIC